MPDLESDAEKEALIQGYVEGLLTPEESARLHQLIRQDPLLARVIAQSLRMDGAIREITSEKETALKSPGREDLSDITPRGGTRRTRSARLSRVHGTGGGQLPIQFAAVLAAAVLLLVLGLLFSTASKPASNEAATQKKAHRLRIEAQEREAEATRRRAEDRLQQIERQREILTRQEPRTTPNPEKQKADLAELEAEKRRIELEMTAIIENTRKAREELATLEGKPSVGTPPVLPRPEGPKPEVKTTVAAPAAVRVVVAKVERMSGDVHLVAEDKRTALTGTQDLLSHHRIETSAGMAAVSFPDRTKVTVAPESAIRDVGIEGGKKLFVDRGDVEAVVAKQKVGQPMVFTTPHGEITVLGTTLKIRVVPGDKGSTRLDVVEGKVRFKNLEGKSAEVVTGYSAVAAAGAADLQVRAIPRSIAEMLLETRGAIGIRFGPAGITPPDGYLIDSGLMYDAIRGYGWDALIGAGTVPGAAADVLKGSWICGGDAQKTVTWKLRIPNGSYAVTVCVGGKGAGVADQGPHHVAFEGKQVVSQWVTRKGEFHEAAAVIPVTDGELTMVIGGHKTNVVMPDGNSDTVVSYIKIQLVGKK